MRVYKNRYYRMRIDPGISSFKKYGEWEWYITTGYKAQNDRTRIIDEYLPDGLGRFILSDGHIPSCQPVVDEKEAFEWLDANPYQHITPVDPIMDAIKPPKEDLKNILTQEIATLAALVLSSIDKDEIDWKLFQNTLTTDKLDKLGWFCNRWEDELGKG